MKCTQCGCEDLEDVNFPYQAKLIMTKCGIVGEATFYDLKEEFYTKSYICIKCGHFEFFNTELVKVILEKRSKEARKRARIKEIESQILKNETAIKTYKENLSIVLEQLNDLDITIRQSNELKLRKAELNEKINALQEEMKDLQEEKSRLE